MPTAPSCPTATDANSIVFTITSVPNVTTAPDVTTGRYKRSGRGCNKYVYKIMTSIIF